MMTIIAPAKLNLFLHITGRRKDGYHLLESLFVFAHFGDEITLTPSDTLQLSVTGPFAHTLTHESPDNNLVLRAAVMLKKLADVSHNVHITLSKQIPVAAGLGGGSSDAASVLIGLNRLWQLNLEVERLCEMGLILGADVPACIRQTAALISGIGEIHHPMQLPHSTLYVLLVNPNTPLSTQTVFKQFRDHHAAFTQSIDHPLRWENWPDCFTYLKTQHNDLEQPAIAHIPVIQEIIYLLQAQAGCLLARMSGSGPTCFGLFETKEAVQLAAKTLRLVMPTAWVQQSTLLTS